MASRQLMAEDRQSCCLEGCHRMARTYGVTTLVAGVDTGMMPISLLLRITSSMFKLGQSDVSLLSPPPPDARWSKVLPASCPQNGNKASYIVGRPSSQSPQLSFPSPIASSHPTPAARPETLVTVSPFPGSAPVDTTGCRHQPRRPTTSPAIRPGRQRR